jgi:hypothetical protein
MAKKSTRPHAKAEPTHNAANELAGAPVCPLCGSMALYDKSSAPIDMRQVGRLYPVICSHCDWHGTHPRVIAPSHL